jgi:hypothetical protein
MSPEDLWGELPEIGNLRTPVEVLKEQATILTAKTKGVLVGEVRPERVPRPEYPFGSSLCIRAPALNNYLTSVASVACPMEMYPLLYWAIDAAGSHQCPDEDALKAKLKGTLQSRQVQKLIAALLRQSNAAQPSDAVPLSAC